MLRSGPLRGELSTSDSSNPAPAKLHAAQTPTLHTWHHITQPAPHATSSSCKAALAHRKLRLLSVKALHAQVCGPAPQPATAVRPLLRISQQWHRLIHCCTRQQVPCRMHAAYVRLHFIQRKQAQPDTSSKPMQQQWLAECRVLACAQQELHFHRGCVCGRCGKWRKRCDR